MYNPPLINLPYPFTQKNSQKLPFQTSPLSIILKPGKPDHPNPPINSFISADHFPTIWGKFSIVYQLIASLPPGSEAATRDVAKAYCTIPLHSSQWPAAVVRGFGDQYYVDTCLAFGAAPSAGVYGHVADAGAELMQHHEIGPLDKWVNDHIFIRIRKDYLTQYNTAHAQWHQEILTNRNIKKTGGRLWFPGKLTQAGLTEEFNKSCTYPIKDLSGSSPHMEHNALFSYNLANIDAFSEHLGIFWEWSKD
ncbi:hypothetical protein ID866_9701 [Astraeus odoratus]|nr:hypothetical protein ID866_9701 [Astraeus odoratus]